MNKNKNVLKIVLIIANINKFQINSLLKMICPPTHTHTLLTELFCGGKN